MAKRRRPFEEGSRLRESATGLSKNESLGSVRCLQSDQNVSLKYDTLGVVWTTPYYIDADAMRVVGRRRRAEMALCQWT